MNGGADPSFPASLLATVLTLALVLVIAWFAIRLLARTGYGGAARKGGRLRVLQSVGLGARERLVLVRFDDREYLLGVAANAITVIEREDPDASAVVRGHDGRNPTHGSSRHVDERE